LTLASSENEILTFDPDESVFTGWQEATMRDRKPRITGKPRISDRVVCERKQVKVLFMMMGL
jgi:hypothetical protein